MRKDAGMAAGPQEVMHTQMLELALQEAQRAVTAAQM